MIPTIRVTNIDTGEYKDYIGKLMVAPNGVIFIKSDKRTIYATTATNITVEEL